MELVKLLGEELYAQVQQKLDDVNGKETDKLKHVRYVDLSEGNYVDKTKYNADLERANNILEGKQRELDAASQLIAELKKGAKDDPELQGKISGYEKEVKELTEQLQETKIKAAVKVGLLEENALDVDYLTFKLMEELKEKGESLTLDGNDGIKGWSERVEGLKTQYPQQFGTGKEGRKILGDNRLPEGDHGQDADPKTLAEALRQKYEEADN